MCHYISGQNGFSSITKKTMLYKKLLLCLLRWVDVRSYRREQQTDRRQKIWKNSKSDEIYTKLLFQVTEAHTLLMFIELRKNISYCLLAQILVPFERKSCRKEYASAHSSYNVIANSQCRRRTVVFKMYKFIFHKNDSTNLQKLLNY